MNAATPPRNFMTSNTTPHSQCAELIARFYHALDASDYTALASLLEADTVWLRQGKELTGPDAIIEALGQRHAERRTAHQLQNLYVTLDESGTTATAKYYVNVYDNQGPSGSLQLKVIMVSEDQFALRDGRWRLLAKRAGKWL